MKQRGGKETVDLQEEKRGDWGTFSYTFVYII